MLTAIASKLSTLAVVLVLTAMFGLVVGHRVTALYQHLSDTFAQMTNLSH